MGCNCKDGNIYQIGFGCCRPSIMPADDFYTKPQIDQMLEEIKESGCCITEEEVDEKISAATSGLQETLIAGDNITISGNVISAEVPSLSGYATEQWVEDKHYITGVDLSDYALKSEIPTVPTNVSAFNNDARYITSDALSGYQPTLIAGDNITISGNVISAVGGGGSGMTSGEVQTMIDQSITGKANTSDVITSISDNRMNSNYGINYTKNGTTYAKWIFTASSGLTVDGRNISVDPSVVAYKDDVTTLINQSVSGKQDTISAGTNVQINNNVISATDTTYTAGDNISISNQNVISTVTKFWCGSEAQWGQISGGTLDNNTIYMVY